MRERAMNTSTLVHVRPGKVADRSVIEAVMTAYPTVSGFSLQHEGELVCEQHKPPQTVDEIMEIQETAKDGHRIFFFGNWPKFEDESDIQPFVVTNAEGANILALNFEGKFSGYSGLNGDHTDEFCLADEVLFPRIEKAYESAGQDFGKFFEELKSKAVTATFSNTFKDRGWFAFLPYTGEPYFFGANTLMKGFPWGTVSNTTGIAFEEEKKPETPKKGLGFLNRKKATATAEEAPATEPTVKPVPDPAVVQPAPQPEPITVKTETSVVAGFTNVKVPPQLNSGVRNAWIRLFNGDRAKGLVGGDGDLPTDHQSKNCEIPVHSSLLEFTKEPVSDTKSMKRLLELVQKGKTADVLPFSKVEGSKSTVREPASNYAQPTLGEEESTRAMEKMIKFLDAAAKKRPAPIEMQKMEAKWPTFSEKIGVKFTDLLLLDVDQICDLFDHDKIGTCAFIEMRRKYIEASGIKLEEIAAGAKAEEATATKTDATQVVVPPAESGSPAAKKSALGFLNRGKKTA